MSAPADQLARRLEGNPAITALRDLIAEVHDYCLWEPGRAGHAAAHRRLVEARNAAEELLPLLALKERG